MCGVVFLFDNRLGPDELRSRANEALWKMRHRGPDDGRVELSGSAVIGHRRLAIIDLPGSHQPMADATGRYILAYNGEIYNYVEERNRLKNRWKFKTNGDTEVLLAGLALDGERFLDRLEGMWAFVLWDRVEQNLFLCRDRLGKKPLYYQQNGDQFLCASELPALKQIVSGDPNEDLNSTADYFRYGFYLPGRTIYQGIKEVLPGHHLSWSPGGEVREKCYWRINSSLAADSIDEASIKLKQYLSQAVKKRLVADVEVGAFLSGGVDSSLIVGLMRELDKTPKTFTMGFGDESYDERCSAQYVADYFQTDHYVDVLDQWSPDYLYTLTADHVGQPFADASILPTALISKLAARHVKVALSGDGGDEIFSGYQRYQARAILRWYTRLPKLLQRTMERSIRGIPEPSSHHSHSLIRKAHLFTSLAQRIESETPYVAPMYFSDSQLHSLIPEVAGLGHRPPRPPEVTHWDDIQQMMCQDALIYLPQDILVKVDRASMAESLEVRAPFLDRKVIELGFSMPIDWHRGSCYGKKALKRACKSVLPGSIWGRRKQGFSVPLGIWFKTQLGDDLLEMSEALDTPVNTSAVHSMLRSHRVGKRDHGLALWLIYSYLAWRRGSSHG